MQNTTESAYNLYFNNS